jgi:hypothetical protein
MRISAIARTLLAMAEIAAARTIWEGRPHDDARYGQHDVEHGLTLAHPHCLTSLGSDGAD